MESCGGSGNVGHNHYKSLYCHCFGGCIHKLRMNIAYSYITAYVYIIMHRYRHLSSKLATSLDTNRTPEVLLNNYCRYITGYYTVFYYTIVDTRYVWTLRDLSAYQVLIPKVYLSHTNRLYTKVFGYIIELSNLLQVGKRTNRR